MKKLLLLSTCIIFILLASACTQYQWIPIPMPDDSQSVITDIEDVQDNINTETILSDALANRYPEKMIVSVEKINETTSSTSRTVSEPGTYRITITLVDYEGEAGGILNGSIIYIFTVASADATPAYEVQNSTISVMAQNATIPLSPTIGGFIGTTSGVSFSSTGITVDSAISVTQNKYNGFYTAGNYTITESGKNNPGSGTENNPFQIRNADDLAAINSYGENAYLQLTSDITAGNIWITTDGITLDFNGHTIDATGSNGILVNGVSTTFIDNTGNGGISAERALWAINGGSITVNSGNYNANTTALTLGQWGKSGETVTIDHGNAVVNGGTFISHNACVSVFAESVLVVNGGSFSADSNTVIMTNGSQELTSHPYSITFNSGVINGFMSPEGREEGYLAGGFYIANAGELNLNGGTLNITGGNGLVIRSGNVNISENVAFNLTNVEGVTEGLVADAKTKIPANCKIVVDTLSAYPGGTPTVTSSTHEITYVTDTNINN